MLSWKGPTGIIKSNQTGPVGDVVVDGEGDNTYPFLSLGTSCNGKFFIGGSDQSQNDILLCIGRR